MTLILSGTDGLSDIDGSAATPAIRGTDANTGIFFPAADTVAMATGGTEAMRVNSSQNMGIGTSSPGYKLDVNGQARLGGSAGTVFGVGTAFAASQAEMYSVSTTPLGLGTTGSASFQFYTDSAERARITSVGDMLVGTTSTQGKLTVSGGGNSIYATQTANNNYTGIFNALNNAGTYYLMAWQANGSTVGSVTSNGSTTSYNTSSDYRLKENIQPMTGALAKIAALKPVTYNWKSTGEADEGFIAHELAEVVPQCVTGEKDATRMEQYEISPAVPATYDEEGNELTPAVAAVMGEREVPVYQGIDTSFLVATLTAAIQEQQALIQSLTARIEALEGK